MTISARTRFYLIAIAVLPPLAIVLMIYGMGINQDEQAFMRSADGSLLQYAQYDFAYREQIKNDAIKLGQSEPVRRYAMQLNSRGSAGAFLSGIPTGFDYVELLDNNLIVMASQHRGGLIGNRVHDKIEYSPSANPVFYETVEYDINGRHAALGLIVPIDERTLLYCGRYLNEAALDMIDGAITSEIMLHFEGDSLSGEIDFSKIEQFKLYESNSKIVSLLHGGKSSGYYLVATFNPDYTNSAFYDLLKITIVIAIVAIVLALAAGIYITGKTKREIDNLVGATERLSKGDFETTIMSYEEGEFAHLADSFSEMVANLKALQGELATAEKIAAWKIVGQKVAHEIKNPLTPITISIDDLRRSYYEDRDDFESIFKETTGTIKTEITRITNMLNEFVSFARMNPPAISKVGIGEWIESIAALYKSDIASNRLNVNSEVKNDYYDFDPEALKQVVINLVKNGLEASGESVVELTITDNAVGLEITITDNGPGFDSNILENKFTPYITTKPNGSGLGLAICQRIVHDHGGTIELSNNKQQGAQAKISLPL